ncbi:MAG: hypothetical protein PVJ10_06165, partial [Thiohalophilus sp.]
ISQLYVLDIQIQLATGKFVIRLRRRYHYQQHADQSEQIAHGKTSISGKGRGRLKRDIGRFGTRLNFFEPVHTF